MLISSGGAVATASPSATDEAQWREDDARTAACKWVHGVLIVLSVIERSNYSCVYQPSSSSSSSSSASSASSAASAAASADND